MLGASVDAEQYLFEHVGRRGDPCRYPAPLLCHVRKEREERCFAGASCADEDRYKSGIVSAAFEGEVHFVDKLRATRQVGRDFAEYGREGVFESLCHTYLALAGKHS